jgi:hypothetical protein
LVQGLWIAVGQNLRLELAEAPGLALDQLQGVGAVGEQGIAARAIDPQQAAGNLAIRR